MYRLRLGSLAILVGLLTLSACGQLPEDVDPNAGPGGKGDTFLLRRISFSLAAARSATKPTYKTFNLRGATAAELLIRIAQASPANQKMELVVYAGSKELVRSRQGKALHIEKTAGVFEYQSGSTTRNVSYEKLILTDPAKAPLGQPKVKVPPSATPNTYKLRLYNYGASPATGEIAIGARRPGVDVIFNTPECYTCSDRTAGMLQAVIDEIGFANTSIDVAIYGLKEKRVLTALCEAARSGVKVRLVGDYKSHDLRDPSRSYYPSFEFLKEQCGASVEFRLDRAAIMHHKFFIIDANTDAPLLLTGSTNQTPDGYNRNHNHILTIAGPPVGLIQAYQAEFDQLFTHCVDNKTRRGAACTQCTAACLENKSAEGPWTVGDTEISVFFSPSDDALARLRGPVQTQKLKRVPAHCQGPNADCVCRASGSDWSCDFCAGNGKRNRQGSFPPPPTTPSWGLMSSAIEGSSAAGHRVMMTMYAGTDQCFALAMGKVANKGGETLAIWDNVNAGSAYTRDKYMCALGIPTYVSRWSNGDAQVRNHNKIIVVDDTIFDGSMNISSSGLDKNSENTLVIRNKRLARKFAHYIRTEAELIESIASNLSNPDKVNYHIRLAMDASPDEKAAAQARCKAKDLVDNDGDGRADDQDPDGDLGTN